MTFGLSGAIGHILLMLRPESWPETIRFLCGEQEGLMRLPTVHAGLPVDAEEIDVLCMKYATTHNWPTPLPKPDRPAILQRFIWARAFCVSLSHAFQKADGTETGRMAYPDWEFEAMMIWLLVQIWHLRENVQKDGMDPVPPRPMQAPPDSKAS